MSYKKHQINVSSNQEPRTTTPVFVVLIYNRYQTTHLGPFTMSKKSKFLKFSEKLWNYPIKPYFLLSFFKTWSQKSEIQHPDFSRIFWIRFFPRKKNWGRLGEVKLLAIFWPLHKYHVLYINWNWGMMGQMRKIGKTTFM